MKNLLKCQEMMTIQQEIYQIICIIKIIIKLLVQSYQVHKSIPKNINFIGKFEDDDGATMFFIAEKQQKTILIFFQAHQLPENNVIMEHQQILNLLNEASGSKFVARKWNIVNDNSNANYNAVDEITYNAEVLKSSLCNYNDAYIHFSKR